MLCITALFTSILSPVKFLTPRVFIGDVMQERVKVQIEIG